MSGCTCENWTVQDLSSALQDMHKENKRIVVPMFQRGKRWNYSQEQAFIDSLIKGYPVGTMLFYETFEDNQRTYILVDGLQRGNSIKKYMTHPTAFFYDNNISDEFCESISRLLGKEDPENYAIIRNLLTSFIKQQTTFKNLQFYSIAKQISDEFSSGISVIDGLIKIITQFFEERQNLYDKIAGTVIPVIIYTGDERNLPEIFDRINSKGTPLDQYEIYAAAWPINEKYTIENSDIIESVVRKYDTFIKDDYQLHRYNREILRTTKRANAFEYLFGLSKYLVEKYEILGFNKNSADDTVNPLAFELVNACLDDTDRIRTLYTKLRTIDLNLLEKDICTAIDFVNGAISVVTKFKGNSRSSKKPFHSKYQILSMISTTFKEMFADGDYFHFSDTWNSRKNILSRNLVQYYVYDIITDYWHDGGTSKIHAASKPNRYMIDIPRRAWMIALDGFFERSMQRAELQKVANPRSEEYVILNCIYLKTFTALDQLSINLFDVEHIAPKEQMRKLIETCNGNGLPISCIANLCYLPEYVNRSKKEKNFYQDKKYLFHVHLDEIENKYSFTKAEDLEWMNTPYTPNDFPVLKEYYTDYCTKRFEKMKHLFCDSLGITYEETEEPPQEISQSVISPVMELKPKTLKVSFSDKCVLRLAHVLNSELIKAGRNSYITADGKSGYIITTSKAYKQGNREKFWFAYRRSALNDLKECEKVFIVYGCKSEDTMVALPVSLIDDNIERLNASRDEDGIITHWHIVFFKDPEGMMTWMLSKPKVEEIEINKFLI